jgi:hypothetical protein
LRLNPDYQGFHRRSVAEFVITFNRMEAHCEMAFSAASTFLPGKKYRI